MGLGIIIDETHMGRRASGIERVTEALFSSRALAPLDVTSERSGQGRLGLALRQTFAMPAKAASNSSTVWVFPGFPPSPAFALLRERAILYVHDVFLVTRRQDLNLAAKYWMAPNFRLALKRFKYFMANSRTTADHLKPLVQEEASILLYRPPAENVFNLAPRPHQAMADPDRPLIVGAVGTVEPRKNFTAAADICERLAEITGRAVELHIVGRRGWGEDFDRLGQRPHVKLHGFVPDEAARGIIAGFDLLLCTSHDEGLGLPLLEAQFGGLQIVAPDQAVFREVLGQSGVFIDPSDAGASAQAIAGWIAREGWRERGAGDAAANIARWNADAEADRGKVVEFLADRLREAA
jgi:glycosyltransferase involved in cell wall biosynthesis